MKQLLAFWILVSGIALAEQGMPPAQKPTILILSSQDPTKEWVQLIAGNTVTTRSTEPSPDTQAAPALVIEASQEQHPTESQHVVLTDGLPLLKVGQQLQPATCKRTTKDGEKKPCCCGDAKPSSKYEAVYTPALEHAALHPYAWMDVSLSMSMIVTLTETLCDLMPQHAEFYKERSDAYLETLKMLDEDIAKTVNLLPEDERKEPNASWLYFSRRYGLKPSSSKNSLLPDLPLKQSSYVETMKYYVDSLQKKRPEA